MKSFKELQVFVEQQIQEESRRIKTFSPANLYEPIGYTLDMGGKRLRPVLALLAYNMFRDDLEQVIPAALAIEIFHNFTLLHDDIMDKADVRRNQPTVHKKYSENVAILSGDAMSILAYQYLLKSPSGNLRQMGELFSKTAIEICEGQQYDMDFETRDNVSIDEYLNMIRLKTAVLLACSLKIGALAAEAPTQTADQLYDFGINLGLAFQLQDDWLDVFADQKKFGKRIGGDIVSNKKTFLLLKALELSKGSTNQSLQEWIKKENFDPEEKIAAITAIYQQLDISEITLQTIETYYQSALKIWKELDLHISQKSELLILAKRVIERDR
jgi:geranylgeranyl diphosphate synthase type II